MRESCDNCPIGFLAVNHCDLHHVVVRNGMAKAPSIPGPDCPYQETVRVLCGCGDIYTYPLNEGGFVDVGTDHRMMCANCASTEGEL